MSETYQRQIQREQDQVTNGIARYRRAVASKDATDLTPGKLLMKRAVEPMAAAIAKLVEATEAGVAGPGRPARALPYLQSCQPEPLAFITARCCINAAAKMERVPKTAMSIASLVEEHYQFDELRTAEPALSNAMERKAKRWSTPHHRRQIMRLAARVGNVQGLDWSQGDKLYFGLKLIELFIESTGLVEQVMVWEGKAQSSYKLRVTEKTSDWLVRMHEKCELLEPRFTPMVHPPVDWTSPVQGGYLTRENRVDLIGGVSAAMRDDVFSVDMTRVFDAVNAIQRTRWAINRPVFDVLTKLWQEGAVIAGLPPQDAVPVPARPSDIPGDMSPDDMAPEVRARFDEWRRSAAEAHEANAALISKRLAVAAQISMASDVKDEEAIWFPHNLDFRGRIYSVVPGLCPQGDDVAKGLLTFADAKPLGESGAYWLHVHIANLFGVDKVPFDERVEWTKDNANRLLDSAISPLDGARFWETAEYPFMALAACFEYAGWHVMGNDYESRLPIAMDGSCSGLQHFSAMLKDAEGGAAVNLCALDRPADIYSRVAERVEALLAQDTEQVGISWRGKVLRRIVKRPCMTFAYSVTSRGMRDQILDEIRKIANGGEYLPGWSNFEASTYLAPIVEAAIRQTVDRAAEAMDWLKAAVRPVVERDEPVTWFTPDGFPVQHRYVKTNGKRFECWFNGQRIRVQLRVETTKQDTRKQQSAIAPNFVHSMDGTHLRMVVNRMAQAGITESFAMVHDSFGVHACDVDTLHLVIRDEFVNLYGEDRLGQFREQILASLPLELHEEVPPCPAAGDLDLTGVYAAEFFFA